MQERSAPNLSELFAPDAHPPGESNGHLGDALGVALGLLVAKIQGPGPALQGRVIRQHELPVGSFKIREEGGVVDRDRSLARQRFQEIDPFFFGGHG